MRRILIAGMCAFGLFAAATTGQEKKDGKPDMAAMMAAMAKGAAVGDQHKMLADMCAGEWKLSIEMWMDPAAPAMKSTATSSAKQILGGRFVDETTKGEFFGMPFEGRGVTGYDNIAKKFVCNWTDNMGTGMLNMTGTLSSDGKTLTMAGECQCPLDGSKMQNRHVTTFHSKDKHELTMYHTMAGGKEEKAMTIVYERVK